VPDPVPTSVASNPNGVTPREPVPEKANAAERSERQRTFAQPWDIESPTSLTLKAWPYFTHLGVKRSATPGLFTVVPSGRRATVVPLIVCPPVGWLRERRDTIKNCGGLFHPFERNFAIRNRRSNRSYSQRHSNSHVPGQKRIWALFIPRKLSTAARVSGLQIGLKYVYFCSLITGSS